MKLQKNQTNWLEALFASLNLTVHILKTFIRVTASGISCIIKIREKKQNYFLKYRGYISHQHTRILHLPQTKYLQNVAYIRLKNLQIGYTLPTGFVNKLGVQQTKVYVSLENIWTYTPFYKHIKQFDVESINGEDFETVELIKQGMYSSPIIEDGGRPYSYPIMKSMTLGLSLTF